MDSETYILRRDHYLAGTKTTKGYQKKKKKILVILHGLYPTDTLVYIDIMTVSIPDDKNIFCSQSLQVKQKCQICYKVLSYATEGCSYDTKHMYLICCGMIICHGCAVTRATKMVNEESNERVCLACNMPLVRSNEESIALCQRRMKIGDPKAFCVLGSAYRAGNWGLVKNMKKAVELWLEGAKRGSLDGNYNLGVAYYHGHGVATSESEAVYHFKLAADGGHEIARYILGKIDHNNGNTEQAMKHYKIAARAGCNSAMACIETGYTEGYINKRECLDTYQEYYKSLHCVRTATLQN